MFFKRRFYDDAPVNRFNHKVDKMMRYGSIYYISKRTSDLLLGTDDMFYLDAMENKMYQNFFEYQEEYEDEW